jgi:hypothetical protein
MYTLPKISSKMKRATMPLKTIVVDHPFTQCILDFIDPINPKSIKIHSIVLMTTFYFTKWPEAIALKVSSLKKLILFLQENFFPGSFFQRNSLLIMVPYSLVPSSQPFAEILV